MDEEYHYWVTAIIAKEAGFTEEEARVIAYSSQYVDENDICYEIFDRSGKRPYRNFVSQSLNILKSKREQLRIYPIFHFVPGDPLTYSARRRDGKMHLLNTTADGPYVRLMMKAAFSAPEKTRLYRIGIATHAYADSWAHQNFVGWYDSFNQMDLDIKPNIGHADAEHHPDWMAHIWCDNRLIEQAVDNRERFLSASAAIFTQYREHTLSQGRTADPGGWEGLYKALVDINQPVFTGDKLLYRDERKRKYTSLAPWLPEFDETAWFSSAVETEIHGLPDSPNSLVPTLFKDSYYWKEDIVKEGSDWYLFQEAVKAHERFSIGLLSDLFKKMGQDLARV